MISVVLRIVTGSIGAIGFYAGDSDAEDQQKSPAADNGGKSDKDKKVEQNKKSNTKSVVDHEIKNQQPSAHQPQSTLQQQVSGGGGGDGGGDVGLSAQPTFEPIQIVRSASMQNSDSRYKKKRPGQNNGKLRLAEYIGDYYEVGDFLSESMYASVQLATHKQTHEVYAVKRIQKDLSLANLEQSALAVAGPVSNAEVALLLELDHPNVLTVHEVYESEAFYFIVTEYCAGGQLFSRIVQDRQLDEARAKDIMRQVLSAVAYLHSKNVIHRDIEPKNIVFARDNHTVKVIDFGFSRHFNRHKKLTKRVQTVSSYFQSPEAIAGDYDEKADVWSCGALLYTMLAGYPPFIGCDEQETKTKILEERVQFPVDDWQHTSDDVKDLIARMLAKDPANRLSAHEALADKWFVPEGVQVVRSEGNNTSFFKNWSQFENKGVNRLQRSMLKFIETNAQAPREAKEIYGTLKKLDPQNTRYLPREEIEHGYYGIVRDRATASRALEEVFEDVAPNQDGLYDYKSLLKLVRKRERELSKKQLDKELEGQTIRKEELIEVLNQSQIVNEKQRTDILSAFEQHNELNKEMFAHFVLQQYD